MKYNMNVVKSVWGWLRKPSRATLDAICAQNAVYSEANGKTDAPTWRNPIPITFGLGEAFDVFAFPNPAGGSGYLPASILTIHPKQLPRATAVVAARLNHNTNV